MKLLIDRNTTLTRIETTTTPESSLILDNEAKDAIIYNTSLDAFKNYEYKGNFKEDIEDKLTIKEVKNLEDALNQANEIKSIILKDSNIYLNYNPKFIESLKHLRIDPKVSDNKLFFQKVTYELEDGENIDEIIEVLKNQKSNALLKSYKKIDDKHLVIFSSTNGLWNIDNQLTTFGKLKADGNKIRTAMTIRSLNDPLELIKDFSKINYALLEDAKALINSDKVNNLYKSFQNQHDNIQWDDDKVAYYLKPYHVKYDLTNEDKETIILNQKVIEEAKKEGSHINKPTPTLKEEKVMVDDNKEKIFTNYSQIIKSTEKVSNVIENIETKKNESIMEFIVRQQEELLEKQRKEIEEQQLNINVAKQQFTSALGEFYKSLENGSNFEHTINNLKGGKYNNFTIQLVSEEVKSDILISKQKDKQIDILNKEKEFYIDESKKRFEAINKLNLEIEEAKHEYSKEKVKSDKLVEEYKELKDDYIDIYSKFNELVNVSKITIDELKTELNETKEEASGYYEELKELNINYDKLKEEFDGLVITITSKDETIKSLNENINSLTNKNNELKSEYKELLEERNEFFSITKDLSSSNKELMETNASLNEALDISDNKVKERNNEIEDLKAQMILLQKELNSKDEELYLYQKADIIETVSNGSLEFENLSDEMKADFDIALAAVKYDGYNIQYVSNDLKEDMEICAEAVKKDKLAIQFLPEEIQNSEIICSIIDRKESLDDILEKLDNETKLVDNTNDDEIVDIKKKSTHHRQ